MKSLSLSWLVSGDPRHLSSLYDDLNDLKVQLQGLVIQYGSSLDEFCIHIDDSRIHAILDSYPVYDVRVFVSNRDGTQYRLLKFDQSVLDLSHNLETYSDWLHDDFDR